MFIQIIRYFILIFFLNSAVFLCKMDGAETVDSSKVHKFPVVNVSADRYLSNPFFSYSSYNLFDKKYITQSNILQITEVISKSPGIFIKNYGGLGGLKTISSRGTTSSQTVILLDGLPISSVQNGSFDLSVFPISIVDKIELVRGGQSSIAGSNAIGGAVNISTDISTDNILTFNSNFGSFNELSTSLGTNFAIEKSSFAIHCEHTACDGSYPFEFTQFGENKTIERTNADFSNTSVSLSNQSEINNVKLKSSLIARKTNRGAPGAVLQGRIESSNARLSDEEMMFTANISKNYSNNNFLKLNSMFRISNMMYSDPDAPGLNTLGQHNRFIARDAIFQASYSIPDTTWFLQFSTAFTFSDLRGNMLDPDVSGNVERLNPNISINFEKNLDGNFFDYQFGGGIRYDMFNDNHPAVSPMLAFSLSANQFPLIVKSQISKNFRMPNFNEMYYLNYGTSNLKPENSMSINLGILSNIEKLFSIEASIFWINTKDQIIAIPKSPVSWSAANIDNVVNQGIELSLRTSVESIFVESIGLNYTYQNSKNMTVGALNYAKLIPFSPQELLNASVKFDFVYLICYFDVEYSSFRYTSPDNNPQYILPANLISNAGVSIPLNADNHKFLLKIDVKNLSNEDYSIVNNYPMPGRQFVIGVNYQLMK